MLLNLFFSSTFFKKGSSTKEGVNCEPSVPFPLRMEKKKKGTSGECLSDSRRDCSFISLDSEEKEEMACNPAADG